MPLTYEVLPREKIVYTLVTGNISLEEFKTFAEKLENDGEINFPHFEIIDLTNLMDFELSYKSYSETSEHLKDYHNKKHRIGSIHIGVNPYSHTVGRMFCSLWEGAGYKSWTVGSFEEAMGIVKREFGKK